MGLTQCCLRFRIDEAKYNISVQIKKVKKIRDDTLKACTRIQREIDIRTKVCTNRDRQFIDQQAHQIRRLRMNANRCKYMDNEILRLEKLQFKLMDLEVLIDKQDIREELNGILESFISSQGFDEVHETKFQVNVDTVSDMVQDSRISDETELLNEEEDSTTNEEIVNSYYIQNLPVVPVNLGFETRTQVQSS